ncbi:MAG: bifunctional 5,10-methylenetetrahydrofolate dehydrogenase/5,10-methenyltetrahydrofolate cyclohydrolase [Planctomycetota bacterium]
MTSKLLDGRLLAQRMRDELRQARLALGDRPLRLVSLEVGENPAARVYLRGQRKAAEDVGIELVEEHLAPDVSLATMLGRITQLNDDPTVAGILLQRPLPSHIPAREAQGAISRRKDVEGMNPANMGAVLYHEPALAPCTASAALRLIQESGIDMAGSEAVVVGHSEIVGKPIAMFLLHHLSTVTVCHVATRRLAEHTRRADILVVAVGKPGLVRGDMVKPGSVVIDIGINTLPDGRVVGDVDHDTVAPVAGFLTPVPGGVGPVTVAMLMRNTLRAAGLQV